MPRQPEPWTIKQRRGYWYYKVRGMDGYRSTGIPIGNWKRTKPLAERYAQDQAGAGPRAAQYNTFGDYAAPYFLSESCPWFSREHGRGNVVQEHYRDQHRSRLEIHILPAFGRTVPGDLSPVAIENWLYRLDYATQTKKHILETLRIVLRDMWRERLISFSPADLKGPVVTHSEREIPTDKEAAALFPSNLDDFRRVWGRRFSIGVACALAYSSGMRTSEIRALSPAAIHPDLHGLVVVETITRDGVPGVPKAKSVRAIPLPRWTLDLLTVQAGHTKARRDRQAKRHDRGIGAAVSNLGNFVFPGRGDRLPHLNSTALRHGLFAVRQQLGIESGITPHGLRHGYNTRMRSLLAASRLDPYFDRSQGFKMSTDATDAVLRAFTGHRSRNMTELYDHPELLQQLRFYDDHFRETVEGYWDFRDTIEQGDDNGEE